MIQTGIVCFAVAAGILLFTGKQKADLSKKVAELKTELGDFADVSTDFIETKNTLYSTQLNSFKAERVESYMHAILDELPKLMSEGVWFDKLRLRYTTSDSTAAKPDAKPFPMKFDLAGYTYKPDSNEQFQTVSQFLNNLRKTELLTEEFKSINLKTTVSQKNGIYDVTYFEIECK